MLKMLNDHNKHNYGGITIEEALDCRDSNSRQFTLINRTNDFRLTITMASVMRSCKFTNNLSI